MIKLRGITWNHSRGFTSIVSVSQRFHELNQSVDIEWDKRSLQAFADAPINELAERYDLLIIDHPWAGFAARTNVIQSLDQYLPESFMKDLATNSVGKSHESYSYDGYQWALAIDAATPVAASRPDLLKSLPETWEDLLEIAKQGCVVIPGIPQDTLMSFYMVCCSLGEEVCVENAYVVSPETGVQALEILRSLGQYIDTECYDMNPINVYESMIGGDKYAYSPFAYGYSNYSRRGYARKTLKFHDLVKINNQKLITTLGGTGLAISSQCKEIDAAKKFVEFAASPEIQSTIFFDNGGQPGHRKAWLDPTVNFNSKNFFKDTLPVLDRAFLRPRYHGHMFFQDNAGAPIREYMMKGGDPRKTLNKLNMLYRDSLAIE